MRAMILAAGLGTRLRPLTDRRPKALVELNGRTLLEITLSRLRSFGVQEAIINVHHYADMVVDYLKAKNNFGMRIEISREEILLDTGGGLKKAGWFFLDDPKRLDEPFFLHNVDILSSIDLRRMLEFHVSNRALATLAVQTRDTSRYLLFDEHLRLCGRRAGRDHEPELIWNHPATAQSPAVPSAGKGSSHVAENSALEIQLQSLAFSGIHVISPRLLPMITEEGVFSIIPAYLRLSGLGEKILAFRADEYYWRDLGRPQDFAHAAGDLKEKIVGQ